MPRVGRVRSVRRRVGHAEGRPCKSAMPRVGRERRRVGHAEQTRPCAPGLTRGPVVVRHARLAMSLFLLQRVCHARLATAGPGSAVTLHWMGHGKGAQEKGGERSCQDGSREGCRLAQEMRPDLPWGSTDRSHVQLPCREHSIEASTTKQPWICAICR